MNQKQPLPKRTPEEVAALLTNLLRPERVYTGGSDESYISFPSWMKRENSEALCAKRASSMNQKLWRQPEMQEAWKALMDAAKLMESAPERAAARIIKERT